MPASESFRLPLLLLLAVGAACAHAPIPKALPVPDFEEAPVGVGISPGRNTVFVELHQGWQLTGTLAIAFRSEIRWRSPVGGQVLFATEEKVAVWQPSSDPARSTLVFLDSSTGAKVGEIGPLGVRVADPPLPGTPRGAPRLERREVSVVAGEEPARVGPIATTWWLTSTDANLRAQFEGPAVRLWWREWMGRARVRAQRLSPAGRNASEKEGLSVSAPICAQALIDLATLKVIESGPCAWTDPELDRRRSVSALEDGHWRVLRDGKERLSLEGDELRRDPSAPAWGLAADLGRESDGHNSFPGFLLVWRSGQTRELRCYAAGEASPRWRVDVSWFDDPLNKTKSAKQVACGASHCCASRADGTVACWNADLAPLPVPALFQAVALAAADEETCAILGSGQVACWGPRIGGLPWPRQDRFPPDGRPVPHLAKQLTEAIALAMNRARACALLGTGRVGCWSLTATAPNEQSFFEARDLGLEHVRSIALDDDRLCWIDEAGTVRCEEGARRFALEAHESEPATAIGSGGGSILALARSGYLTRWVFPRSGAPGGWTGDVQVSRRDAKATLLAAGPAGTCLGDFKKLRCQPWTEEYSRDLELWQPQVSIGGRLSCAAIPKGPVKCWRNELLKAVQIPFPEAVSVQSVDSTVCVLGRDGRAACWEPARDEAPVAVAGLGSAAGLKLTANWSCAVQRDGRVACWGPAKPYQAYLVPGIGDAISVGIAGAHACALRRGGLVSCWGRVYRSNGRADGDAPVGDGVHPEPMTWLKGIVELQVTDEGGCARPKHGPIECWGNSGQWTLPEGSELPSAGGAERPAQPSAASEGAGRFRWEGVPVEGPQAIRELVQAGGRVIAIDALGQLWTWPADVTKALGPFEIDLEGGRASGSR